jgi:alpha-tubulin suppressor-like RCC1 family protein
MDLDDVLALSGGAGHSCALLTDGTATCWGRNNEGQLGDRTTIDRPTATPVAGVTDAASIAAGVSHTCVTRLDGTARCWGRNSSGQLGHHHATASVPRSLSVEKPWLLVGADAPTTGFGTHTCAMLSVGRTTCWGNNTEGQLGDGTITSRLHPGLGPYEGNHIISVEAGEGHTCLWNDDNEVQCWGRNTDGQLGDGTTSSRPYPSHVTLGRDLALGYNHTCAVLDDVVCWGDNDHGQVGDGTTVDRTSPFWPLYFGLSVAAGGNHTCATGVEDPETLDFAVYCWGDNSSGQLGDGTYESRSTPTPVPGLPLAPLAGGGAHTCALLVDRTVTCWGDNSSGQLGDGTTTTRATPAPVVGLAGVASLDLGEAHSCAVLLDGTARCWGANEDGQLGDGTTTSRLTPVPVVGVSGASEISAGRTHTCATLEGSIHCWGANTAGQLGDGTTARRLLPFFVMLDR